MQLKSKVLDVERTSPSQSREDLKEFSFYALNGCRLLVNWSAHSRRLSYCIHGRPSCIGPLDLLFTLRPRRLSLWKETVTAARLSCTTTICRGSEENRFVSRKSSRRSRRKIYQNREILSTATTPSTMIKTANSLASHPNGRVSSARPRVKSPLVMSYR